MLKKFLVSTILVLTFILPNVIFSQTTAKDQQAVIIQLQEQIKILQDQITALTKQIEGQSKEIEKIKTEVAFTRTLQRGMTGDEVKKLQEFLKQFPDIYPEGLVTGYYGPLTETAVRKLQEKQGLESVGFVGPRTLSKLNELVIEGAGSSGTIPPGLLTAPGIAKKVEIPAISVLQATTTTTATSTVLTTVQATTTLSTPVITVTATTSATATSTTLSSPVSSSGSGTSGAGVTTVTTTIATITGTGTSSSATTTTSTVNTPPITVTSPNGGEAWQYSLNYRLGYVLNAISPSRIGVKLFKGSAVVYETVTSTTWGDGIFHITLSSANLYSSVGSGDNYKIRIYDQDNPGVYDDSDNYFTILPVDITQPVASSVSASGVTSNSAVITWTTDEPTDGFINYGSTPTNWVVTSTNTSYTTSHSFTLSNLGSNTLYTYRIYSRDATGNGLQGTPDYTFTTLSGPVSCSAINLTLSDGKTTYIKGVDNFVNYTWTCSPGGSADVNIGIQKPGLLGWVSLNTTTNSGAQTLSIDISGADYPVGTYDLEACFNVCGSIVAEKTFSISSPTSFLDTRTSNLSTVYYTLESLKVLIEKLSKLLQ